MAVRVGRRAGEIDVLCAVSGIDSAGWARVHTLLVAGVANPLLKTPTKLKIQHTLSRATLSSVLQATQI